MSRLDEIRARVKEYHAVNDPYGDSWPSGTSEEGRDREALLSLIDAMQPVVDAAERWNDLNCWGDGGENPELALEKAVDAYQAWKEEHEQA